MPHRATSDAAGSRPDRTATRAHAACKPHQAGKRRVADEPRRDRSGFGSAALAVAAVVCHLMRRSQATETGCVMRGGGAYAALEARFGKLGALNGALDVLHWDRAVNMPQGGAAARADQIVALERICHGLLVEDGMADRLDEAAEEVAADPWRSANVREMRRAWIHAAAVDADLLEARSRAEAACEMAWRSARANDDFAAIKPYLETVLDLVRRTGQAKAEILGCTDFEALMDAYEPGARAARIDALLDDLAGFLPDFLAEVLEAQAGRPQPLPLDGPFPVEAQRALAHRLMERLGFRFDNGRLDESLHPFCGGVPEDIRITTRYDQAEFIQAVMAVLHETGHALYEMGLPTDWRGQPVGRARGMAMHESQSLMIEMQACRSAAFIGFLAPLVREAFAGSGTAWQEANLRRHYHRVAPGLIRVDADEVTYPAHVILRYRLERAMVAGTLAVADLPGAWSEGMEQLLGIRPPDDARGCLQDIHWYDGAWGYFPTYTMGAMAAAQLFAAAENAEPAIPDGLAGGDFAPLMAWLGEHVHRKGAFPASSDALLEAATGAPLGTAAFKQHLRARYLAH